MDICDILSVHAGERLQSVSKKRRNMDIMLLFAAINTDNLDVTTPSRTLLPKLLSVVAE